MILASVLFIGVPPLGFTLVAVLVVLVTALCISVSHRRHRPNIPLQHDPDAAYRDLEEKVRHPYRHALKRLRLR